MGSATNGSSHVASKILQHWTPEKNGKTIGTLKAIGRGNVPGLQFICDWQTGPQQPWQPGIVIMVTISSYFSNFELTANITVSLRQIKFCEIVVT
jgi:hypothetical protein